MDALSEHQRKCQVLSKELCALRTRVKTVGLKKATSNLFRHRDRRGTLDVRSFNRVLHIDREHLLANVEGMATYETIVDETLRYGLLPAVVPQLKTITAGGAVSGLGIESSSFKFGLVHETVEDLEVLLGDGRIITCSRCENQDLFFGLPNSYGTLGYVMRLKLKLIPAKQYVHIVHKRHSDPRRYFAQIAEICSAKESEYVDGTVFNRDEMYITTARSCDSAPFLSDYRFMRIYYKSIRERKEDWLTTKDYIWRWDTDWFWCSRQFGLQNPVMRFLSRWSLNSHTYQRLMRLSYLLPTGSKKTESVIQDVDIPLERAVEFLQFLFAEVGITPVWICPFQSPSRDVSYDLYALDPAQFYINFGFWDVIPTDHEDGYCNRKIERMAQELGGKKALYSNSYYDEETFWKIYNKRRYDELKMKYDPGGSFRNLYEKCVERK